VGPCRDGLEALAQKSKVHDLHGACRAARESRASDQTPSTRESGKMDA
jgi:hypothetical protein